MDLDISNPRLSSPLSLPIGTVTFLFTDVEGSMRLWEQSPNEMRMAMVRHDSIIEASVAENGGTLVRPRGEGDSRFAVFPRASDAVAAAGAIQHRLADEVWCTPWSIRVRIALHTGEADLRDGDYYGAAVNHCARLRSAAYGGQTLVSQTTGDLVMDSIPSGFSLQDMGEHHLKDRGAHERIFQLVLPDLPGEFPPLMGLRPHTNLPVLLTSFVGREQEIAELRAQITSTRLVTITGAGGAGKSRLALQVAADVVDAYRNGVWCVELSALGDAASVPQAIASAVGIREQQGIQLTQTLMEYFLSKHLLLILDNCEHLVHAVAELTEMLLRSATGLSILATSREPLGTAGEVIWSIRPLSTPYAYEEITPEDLTRYDAVRLFLDRAAAAKPGFALTDENAGTVARICGQLDGIPLAIELAAARLRILSLAEIAKRMHGRFRLLATGTRTAPPRQQTLRASIGWSYDLLSEPERVLFRRLSIFAGGWTLEAAERVCPDPSDETGSCNPDTCNVLELLGNLVEKSLVVADCQSSQDRYYFLDMIHQYSSELLAESAEREQVARRHAEYFCGMAAGCYRELWGSKQGYWLTRLQADHENIRSALEWATQDKERAPVLLRLAGSLWRFWEIGGYISEGRTWLERALAANPSARAYERANALRGAGELTREHGDYALARTFHEQSLVLFRECKYQPGVGRELDALGEIAGYLGDYERALELYTASLALRREIGDSQGIAVVLVHLADIATERGKYQHASELLEESLALNRQLQDKLFTGLSLNAMGTVLLQRGECEHASIYFEQALSLYREMNDQLGISNSLKNLATTAKDRGEFSQAVTLYGECQAIKQALGDKRGIARAFVYLGEIALLRGDYGLAVLMCEEGLTLMSGQRVRAILTAALIVKAYAAQEQGDHTRAAMLCQEILTIGERPTPNVSASAHGIAGAGALAQGEPAKAIEQFDAALATYRDLGRQKDVAFILAQSSRAMLQQGDRPRAQLLAEQALDISQQLGLKWHQALALHALGWIEASQGNEPHAISLFQASLALGIEQSNRRGICDCLCALASLQTQWQPAGAARLFSFAEKQRQALGSIMGKLERQEYERHLTAIRHQIGNASFEMAWTAGQEMSAKQAIEQAQNISDPS